MDRGESVFHPSLELSPRLLSHGISPPGRNDCTIQDIRKCACVQSGMALVLDLNIYIRTMRFPPSIRFEYSNSNNSYSNYLSTRSLGNNYSTCLLSAIFTWLVAKIQFTYNFFEMQDTTIFHFGFSKHFWVWFCLIKLQLPRIFDFIHEIWLAAVSPQNPQLSWLNYTFDNVFYHDADWLKFIPTRLGSWNVSQNKRSAKLCDVWIDSWYRTSL